MIAPIRVLIVDDHEAVRSGVAAILGTDPDLVVVGEASTGLDACAACLELAPDIALVDLRMPGTDGIWATERITAETSTRVLVLTTSDEDDKISAALAAGAHGYLLKSTSGAELIAAVKHVAADRHVLDPAIAGTVIAQAAAATANAAATARAVRESQIGTPDWVTHLTARETDVLRLLVAGLGNQEIADLLHIGLTTVKTHVGALYAKSGADSRVALASAGGAVASGSEPGSALSSELDSAT